MMLQLDDPSLLNSQALIDGQWTDADNRETYAVHNPATGEVIAQVASCGATEANRAVAAAEHAMPEWRSRTAKERSNILRRWFNLLMENQEDLARILTAEQGKTLEEARAEIAYGANFIEWFAEEAKRIYGDTIAPPSSDKRLVVIKQPIGVVACITPWNFPNAMLTRKLGPALAAGCAAVCKPANETPLSAHAIAVLAERAGIPTGIINIVSGRTSELGEVLTHHPSIRKLTFTGSTKVGKYLMQACASTVKRTSMELGGNAPFLLFDDADIDLAIRGVMTCKLRNGGQTCASANRFLVQDGIYDAFAEKLSTTLNAQVVGNGAEEGVNLGPMINRGAADNIYSLIDDAIQRGATLISGGQRSDLGQCFVSPTVLGDTHCDMRIFNEEIFGPVAALSRFSTEEEAIHIANDTPYGLAAYLYTRDFSRVWRVSEALEYGMVGINEAMISNEMTPFGGVKESGNGREGSKYGMDDYLEIKYLCLGGIATNLDDS